jgi:hypothetical protein
MVKPTAALPRRITETNCRSDAHEHHHHERWHADLLQGLGQRTADRFPSWMNPDLLAFIKA